MLMGDGEIVTVPGVGQRAENDQIVSGGTCVGARLVIIRVAIRAWASVLEEQRIGRRTTRVRRRVRVAAAKPRITEGLARAPARHAPAAAVHARHPQLRRTPAVEVDETPRGAAPAPGAVLRHDQHRKVVTVDQTHVVEVQPVGAVQSELCQCRRRLGPADALYFAGAAVGGAAGELSVRVLTAEGPCPYPTRPGFREFQRLRVSTLESKSGGGKRRRGGAGE